MRREPLCPHPRRVASGGGCQRPAQSSIRPRSFIESPAHRSPYHDSEPLNRQRTSVHVFFGGFTSQECGRWSMGRYVSCPFFVLDGTAHTFVLVFSNSFLFSRQRGMTWATWHRCHCRRSETRPRRNIHVMAPPTRDAKF